MKRIFTILTAVLLTATVWAQSPEKMSYQAVIRNSSNALVTSTAVGMQISILQGSASGTVVYTETQTPTTNANGLVSIEIGGGTGFASINWSAGTYFVKTETDPAGGTNYTITGTSQLLSVPYALFSNSVNNLKINFATPDYISLGASAGHNIDLTGNSSGNMFFGNWSGQYNIDGSSNIYLGQASGENNIHGSKNILIGRASGQKNLDDGNTMIGYGAGWMHETGMHNIFIGYESGRGNKTGSMNVMLGDSAGRNIDGSGNVFIGYCAGANTNSSNKLIISNSNTTTPLIYGEFDNAAVTINDVLKLTSRSSVPSNPISGTIYVGTDNHIYCYLNGIWKQLDN